MKNLLAVSILALYSVSASALTIENKDENNNIGINIPEFGNMGPYVLAGDNYLFDIRPGIVHARNSGSSLMTVQIFVDNNVVCEATTSLDQPDGVINSKTVRYDPSDPTKCAIR